MGQGSLNQPSLDQQVALCPIDALQKYDGLKAKIAHHEAAYAQLQQQLEPAVAGHAAKNELVKRVFRDVSEALEQLATRSEMLKACVAETPRVEKVDVANSWTKQALVVDLQNEAREIQRHIVWLQGQNAVQGQGLKKLYGNVIHGLFTVASQSIMKTAEKVAVEIVEKAFVLVEKISTSPPVAASLQLLAYGKDQISLKMSQAALDQQAIMGLKVLDGIDGLLEFRAAIAPAALIGQPLSVEQINTGFDTLHTKFEMWQKVLSNVDLTQLQPLQRGGQTIINTLRNFEANIDVLQATHPDEAYALRQRFVVLKTEVKKAIDTNAATHLDVVSHSMQSAFARGVRGLDIAALVQAHQKMTATAHAVEILKTFSDQLKN